MQINGKEYILPTIMPSTIAKLERRGLIFKRVEEMPVTAAIAFLSLCVGSTQKAEKLIDEHVAAGGSLDPIYDEIIAAVNVSPVLKRSGGEPVDTD